MPRFNWSTDRSCVVKCLILQLGMGVGVGVAGQDIGRRYLTSFGVGGALR